MKLLLTTLLLGLLVLTACDRSSFIDGPAICDHYCGGRMISQISTIDGGADLVCFSNRTVTYTPDTTIVVKCTT